MSADVLQSLSQINESQLGGIGDQREHAFTKKGIPQSHTIETTHEPALLQIRRRLPYLNAGSIAKAVQTGVGLDDVRPKPCTAFLVAALSYRTAVDDSLEVLIEVTLYLCCRNSCFMEWLM